MRNRTNESCTHSTALRQHLCGAALALLEDLNFPLNDDIELVALRCGGDERAANRARAASNACAANKARAGKGVRWVEWTTDPFLPPQRLPGRRGSKVPEE